MKEHEHDFRGSNVVVPLALAYDGIGYRNLRVDVCVGCGVLRLTDAARQSVYLNLASAADAAAPTTPEG